MQYKIEIPAHNQKPHLDLELECQRIKNGLFTFIVRVAEKKIVDLVYLSYSNEKGVLKTMNVIGNRRIKYPIDKTIPETIYQFPKIFKNIPFHYEVAKHVQNLPYGQLTFNVVLKDGIGI